jgi:hypothetical protein
MAMAWSMRGAGVDSSHVPCRGEKYRKGERGDGVSVVCGHGVRAWLGVHGEKIRPAE